MREHDDAATTRRRRRQPRCRCSPGSQSLQPPRSRCRIWGWGPRRRTTGCSPRGACFLDWLDVGLWADIAGQAGAVPTVRRLQAAARGAGRLRRGAGAPHARVAAAPDLAGGFLHELTENQRSDQKIFPFLEWLRVRRSRWSCGMQCRGRRSSRGVGPDTCLVISHAHRIAINDAVVLEQALRWPKAASSRSGRSGAVFVGRRPELLGSGAAPLHAAVPRDHLRQLVGAHAAREGLALRRRQPAFFGEAPLRRRVAGHEREANLRILNFGPSPRARGGIGS